ncbi:hypothetical protein [Anabaena sp. CCY 0017]|uniref:hypothetical protein n=1 Tax=Anabaena sp. CCY 0017 TaxID=3103866 RepID=UPI0039C5E028
MKCIKCNTVNTLKDRTANQGRCKNCNYQFAFEPTNMGEFKITDPFFEKAIADISANNTLFFTPKQFFYLIDKRLRNKKNVLFYLIDSLQSKDNFLLNFPFANILINWSLCSIFLFPYSGIAAFIIALLFNQMNSLKRSYYQSKKLAKILIVLGIITLVVSVIFGLANNLFSSVAFGTIIVIGILAIYLGRREIRSYYQSKKSAKIFIVLGIITLVVSVIFGLANNLFSLSSSVAFGTIIGILAIYLGRRELAQPPTNTQTFRISHSQFQDWLASWRRVNNEIDKILPPPLSASRPITINPDITAYSFDRLVVCDSAAVAQMLIANNFHFENNCAILSITGYPESIFDTTMQMLRSNADLKIYAFHECSAKGMNLINHLSISPKWFKDRDITIIDVGLLPRQILAASRNILIQNSPELAEAAKILAPEVRQSLLNEELVWLEAGNFVELEYFSPQKLMQILHRGIFNSQTLNNSGSNLLLVDDSGNSNSMYIFQSFG